MDRLHSFTLRFKIINISQKNGQWASQRFVEVVLVVKNPPANTEDIRDQVQFLGQEDPLEEGMATHSSILAWRIPWTEEPGGLLRKTWA